MGYQDYLNRVMSEGFSFETEKANILLVGNGTYNIDVKNEIEHTPVSFIDDEGEKQEDIGIHITDNKSSGPLTYQQEKMGWKGETILSLSFPKGAKEEVVKAIKSIFKKHWMFGNKFVVEELPKYRQPQTRKG